MVGFRRVMHSGVLLIASFLAFTARAGEVGHLHHVHMNVADVQRTTDFYRKVFGVVTTQYNNRVPALQMERSFLFLNRTVAKIANHQLTGFTHVCWGTRDGHQTADWLKGQGIEFYTPVEELFPGSTYMYIYGPDREVIELTDSVRNMRFNHVHMVAKDEKEAKQTAEWFRALIDFDKPVVSGPLRNENLSIDGVLFAIFPIGARFTPRENDGTLRNTDGSNLDHIAFSFRDLGAAYKRIRASGVAIILPMARDPEYGFRHFFVRAPNGILVELVEARPWPDAAWER